jgi:hypothetical protein
VSWRPSTVLQGYSQLSVSPECSTSDGVSRRDVSVVKGAAHSDVSLVGQRDGGEDGAAEGDVVQRIDDEREGVDEDLASPFESPEINVGCLHTQ